MSGNTIILHFSLNYEVVLKNKIVGLEKTVGLKANLKHSEIQGLDISFVSDTFENKIRGVERTRAVTVLLLFFRIASAFTFRMCV